MTVEAFLRTRLFQALLWPDQIDAVVARLSVPRRSDRRSLGVEVLASVWEDYDETTRAVLWLAASETAIGWLREHVPEAVSLRLLEGGP
jgi:hypothetical protein